MTGDNANVFYTKRIGEKPGKSTVARKAEQNIEDTVVVVHDTTLKTCDSLKEVHSASGNLAKVNPFDTYMRIVREQRIPNVNMSRLLFFIHAKVHK